MEGLPFKGQGRSRVFRTRATVSSFRLLVHPSDAGRCTQNHTQTLTHKQDKIRMKSPRHPVIQAAEPFSGHAQLDPAGTPNRGCVRHPTPQKANPSKSLLTEQTLVMMLPAPREGSLLENARGITASCTMHSSKRGRASNAWCAGLAPAASHYLGRP